MCDQRDTSPPHQEMKVRAALLAKTKRKPRSEEIASNLNKSSKEWEKDNTDRELVSLEL